MSKFVTSMEDWAEHITRGADGAPVVPPLYVLETGSAVDLVDLRDVATATGPVGFIPGSIFPDAAALDAAARRATGRPMVLVSPDGSEAAALALRLETAGGTRVAAMAGGLAAWRGLGFGVSRDPGRLLRDFAPMPSTISEDGRLTEEALRTFLADPRSTHWIQLASLSFRASLSCVDGRDGRAVIGTPGGDAGEFVLFLAAVEAVTGESLSEAQIESALVAHLDAFSNFYLHTDTHALEHLHAELRADPRTAAAIPDGVDPGAWQAFFAAPEPAAQEALLEHVGSPSHVGCGHLRLQLEHPRQYRVRADVVSAVIRSFFRLLWAGVPEVRPVILEGGHEEGAVVQVVMAQEPWTHSEIPIVTPSWEGHQVFVNHPDVARYCRSAVARFHAQVKSPLPVTEEHVPSLLETMNSLGDVQMGATLGHLASGRNLFEARFSLDGSVSVAQVGHID